MTVCHCCQELILYSSRQPPAFRVLHDRVLLHECEVRAAKHVACMACYDNSRREDARLKSAENREETAAPYADGITESKVRDMLKVAAWPTVEDEYLRSAMTVVSIQAVAGARAWWEVQYGQMNDKALVRLFPSWR